MSGWFQFPVALWPAIAESLMSLEEAWPEEAILADLIWWDDQVRIGRYRRPPTRAALHRRWGVTDYRAKVILREKRWRNGFAAPVAQASQRPTKDNAPNPQRFDQISPTDRLARAIHRETEKEEEAQGAPPPTGRHGPRTTLWEETAIAIRRGVVAGANPTLAALAADCHAIEERWQQEGGDAKGNSPTELAKKLRILARYARQSSSTYLRQRAGSPAQLCSLKHYQGNLDAALAWNAQQQPQGADAAAVATDAASRLLRRWVPAATEGVHPYPGEPGKAERYEDIVASIWGAPGQLVASAQDDFKATAAQAYKAWMASEVRP